MAGIENFRTVSSLNQIYGENVNKRSELKGPLVLVGRSLKADVKLENPNVSRKHCFLTQSKNKWIIKDCKSQNGTFVNGVMLKPGESTVLQSGDIIFLGPPSELPQAFIFQVDYKSQEGDEAAIQPDPQPVDISSKESIPSNEDVAIVLENKVQENNINGNCTLSKKSRSKRKLPSSKNTSKKTKITLDAETDKSDKHPLEKDESLVNNSLNKIMDCNQVNEISSTDNEKMEDSLSLLEDSEKEIKSLELSTTDDIYEPGCSHSNTSLEEKFKLKLASLSNKIKELKTAKSLILKNYEDVSKRNKALDEQLNEQKNLKEELQNCELRAKNEVKKELLEKFGEDLVCIICSELLIKPSVLDCSHTFCEYCIKVWKKNKNECPMCRKRIETITRVLTLDNFIEKTVQTLTPEQRDNREKLIKERQELEKELNAPPKRKKSARRHSRPNSRNRNTSRDSVEIIGENPSIYPRIISALPFPLFLNNHNFRRTPEVLRVSLEGLTIANNANDVFY